MSSKAQTKAEQEAERLQAASEAGEPTGDLVSTPDNRGEIIAEQTGEVGAAPLTSDGLFEVTLAHPITNDQHKVYLGLPVEEDYPTLSTVRVTRESASALIGAGYAKDIDPDNNEAVQAALTVEPSSTSGNTKSDK